MVRPKTSSCVLEAVLKTSFVLLLSVVIGCGGGTVTPLPGGNGPSQAVIAFAVGQANIIQGQSTTNHVERDQWRVIFYFACGGFRHAVVVRISDCGADTNHYLRRHGDGRKWKDSDEYDYGKRRTRTICAHDDVECFPKRCGCGTELDFDMDEHKLDGGCD
jgi:hypothetical protein